MVELSLIKILKTTITEPTVLKGNSIMQGLVSFLGRIYAGLAVHIVLGISFGAALGAHDANVYTQFQTE